MANDALARGAPAGKRGGAGAAAPLVRQLWLDAFRLIVLVTILTMTLLVVPGYVFVWVIYLAYLPVAAWALWESAHGRLSTRRLWFFMVVDTLFVGLLAYLIGTSVTPSGVGYMVVLVAYTLLGGRRMGLACLAIGLISLAGLLALEHFGVLVRAPLLPRDHPPFTNPGGAVSAFMFVVVFLVMNFAWLLYVVRRILDYHNQQHRSLIARQQALARAARMTRALQRTDRLETLGRVAGSIAHDFNNLLTVIKGFTKEVIEAGGDASRPSKDLQEVLQAAARAQSLVVKLLAFSRRHESRPVATDLNQLVREAHKMLDPALGEDIEIHLDQCQTPLPVRIDPGQIEQLLVALAVNSRDAIPATGRVSLQTRQRVFAASDSGRPPGLHAGRYAELRFADDGPGMPAEVRARVFEPFFTTKPPGEGTGLGLSVAYGIARQNGGDIRVESRPGRGTTFILLLPCLEGACDDAPDPGGRHDS